MGVQGVQLTVTNRKTLTKMQCVYRVYILKGRNKCMIYRAYGIHHQCTSQVFGSYADMAQAFMSLSIITKSFNSATTTTVAALQKVGIRVVVVHGGGPQINSMLEKVGVESRFEGGMRVSSTEVVEVAEMVLWSTLSRCCCGFESDDEVKSFSERNQQQTFGLITYDVC